MESDNLLLLIAIIAVVVSIIGVGVTYRRATLLSGLASSGDINISISAVAAINFTVDVINWSNGSVYANATYADLYSNNATVDNGTWTPVSRGFLVENIGNNNLSVNLSGGKNAGGFIGGTSPAYMYNVSNNETDTCTASDYSLDTYYDVNTTSRMICNPMQFDSDKDECNIDIYLRIPETADPGTKSDIITLTIQSA